MLGLVANQAALAASLELEDQRIALTAAVHELGEVFRACGATILEPPTIEQGACVFGFGSTPLCAEQPTAAARNG